jgi:hypothetical protein
MDSPEPQVTFDPLHEIELWLRECVDRHRFFATVEGSSMTPLDHAWYEAQMRALADRINALRIAHDARAGHPCLEPAEAEVAQAR